MSSQDMQFADPEWQPPEEREDNANSREQKVPPRPINANRLDQPQWQTPVPQEGYLGPGYAASQPQTTWSGPARPMPRRRGNPWRWIILAFIIIALMSGAFSRGFNGYGGSGPQQSFPKEQAQYFKVATNTPPTIIINGGEGDINVSASNASGDVSIQESGPFGNSREVSTTQGVNTITVDDQGGVGLDVVVPTNANLQINTSGGSIDVEGVNLTGSSSLISNGGNVTFNGSLSPGNYQFQSTNGNGSVNVTLPSTSNFHLDASTNSGTINNGFSSVPITGNQTHIDIGNSSTAKQTMLTLTSDSGDINLSQAS